MLFGFAAPAEQSISLTQPAGANVVERYDVLMGTDVGILILSDDEPLALAAIDKGFKEMRRVEALMTDWRDSEFERINQFAGEKAVRVSDEVMFLLQEAALVSQITAGAFDISYAGVGKLWSIDAEHFKRPTQPQIDKALQLVGYEKIDIEFVSNSVFLPIEGMRIGLGGIAKGYAVDRAIKVIKAMGLNNFAVNAGGDLTVKGMQSGDLWKVAIRHPRDLDRNIAVLPISNGTVVTSGDSERYIEIGGERFSHIIDPRNGYPANRCQSVTIIAKAAYLADALATGVFVLGPKEGMTLIESQQHVEGLIVDAQGVAHVSSGLKGASGIRKSL